MHGDNRPQQRWVGRIRLQTPCPRVASRGNDVFLSYTSSLAERLLEYL